MVEAYAGVHATLAHLTVSGDGDDTGVLAYSGSQLGLDDVVVDGGDCAVAVFNAAVDLTDSTLQHGGGASCSGGLPVSGDLGFTGGTVNLTRTQILDPAVGAAGVDMQGGTLTADQSFFDDSGHPLGTNNSTGLDMGVGTATITRSTFHNWGVQAVDVDGGTATLSDATFQNNSGGVFGDSGSTTVLRSTFQSNGASLLGTTVSVAGSVLASVPMGTSECSGTVTDLGYNLATDDSCGLTEATSQESVQSDALHLDTDLADRGGPFGLPTVATFWGSAAVDAIPSGATYGSPAAPLCPATGTTDLRGIPRPVGGACDAGSMELSETTANVTGPRTAKPHADVEFTAVLGRVDPDDLGLESPNGTVTFETGNTALCQDVTIPPGNPREASCSTTSLATGRRTVTATFTPTFGVSTLHSSVSAPRTVKVGTKPKIKAPGRVVVRVGRKASVKLKASGKPTPALVLSKGHLPKGLSFHKGTGKASITGRATRSAVGTYHLKVRATNLMGKTTHRLTLVVKRG